MVFVTRKTSLFFEVICIYEHYSWHHKPVETNHGHGHECADIKHGYQSTSCLLLFDMWALCWLVIVISMEGNECWWEGPYLHLLCIDSGIIYEGESAMREWMCFETFSEGLKPCHHTTPPQPPHTHRAQFAHRLIWFATCIPFKKSVRVTTGFDKQPILRSAFWHRGLDNLVTTVRLLINGDWRGSCWKQKSLHLLCAADKETLICPAQQDIAHPDDSPS